jgi:hypothetical protein
VPENNTGSFYQAGASDPDGNQVTFTIAGGLDASRFAITPSGQLSFVAPPNFETPADSDRDNVYQLQLGVSDGQASATLTLNVTVTDSREGIGVRRVATGFIKPVAISAVSESLLLVAEKDGVVFAFNPQNGNRVQLGRIGNVGGAGVLSIISERDFASTGTFIAMYATANGYLVVARFVRNLAGQYEIDTVRSLLSVPAPDYSGGGWLGRDADGNLLVATGDAGPRGDPSGSAQQSNSFFGKLIRVTPNPDPYAGASPNFYLFSNIAKGLHMPNGGALFSGGVLLADAGQDTTDEINLLPSVIDPARNFGWPFKEGTRVVQGSPPADALDPVIEYARAAGQRVGSGIVGGAIGGKLIPSLSGHYVFADRGGALFSVPASTLQNGRTLSLSAVERRDADFRPDAGLIDSPVAITADSAGLIFILDGDGEIFRVDAN